MQHFGSGDVVDLISAMHPRVGRMRILTLLKHSQRMPFPREKMEVGRGWRLSYEIDEVMKLVLLFELLATGVTPLIAARLISTSWDDIAAAFARTVTDREVAEGQLMLTTAPDGLGGEMPDLLDIGATDALWRDKEKIPRGIVAVDLLATGRALDEAIREVAASPRLAALPGVVAEWARSRSS